MAQNQTLIAFEYGISAANSTGLYYSTTINTGNGASSVVGGVTVSSSNVTIGNSTVNVSTNSTHFFAGNSTYYGFGNSTTDAIISPAGNNVLTPTSLTINSASGVITTVAASIGANSSQSFTVNNNIVTSDSIVVASIGDYSGTFGLNGHP